MCMATATCHAVAYRWPITPDLNGAPEFLPFLPERAGVRASGGSNANFYAIAHHIQFIIHKETMKSSLALLTLATFAASAFAVAPPETLPSGVKIVHMVDGTGAQPKASDTVKVHYRGTLADGKEFDSSIKRGAPASFPLNRVVPCWTEGMQKIKVGGKATLTCPPASAYGDRGAGNAVPPNATLTFEVELLAIEK